MDLEVNSTHLSPNFSTKVIPVEFVVLHYTACDLKHTLEIFLDPARKVCSHFVISESGEIFDLGNFLAQGIFLEGAHAGKSIFKTGGKTWEAFNQFSIGIELVNLNGNVKSYPESQLWALYRLLELLKKVFPSLKDPHRIVGHEHIAGFRGKCDPGRLFPWKELFQRLYPEVKAPKREALMSEEFCAELNEYLATVPSSQKQVSEFWSHLSSDLEKNLSQVKL